MRRRSGSRTPRRPARRESAPAAAGNRADRTPDRRPARRPRRRSSARWPCERPRPCRGCGRGGKRGCAESSAASRCNSSQEPSPEPSSTTTSSKSRSSGTASTRRTIVANVQRSLYSGIRTESLRIGWAIRRGVHRHSGSSFGGVRRRQAAATSPFSRRSGRCTRALGGRGRRGDRLEEGFLAGETGLQPGAKIGEIAGKK